MSIKVKKKSDIIDLLDYQIDNYLKNKETLNFYLTKVKQYEDTHLYTTSMAVSLTHSLICRLPRDMQNEDGIQRALNLSKVKKIANKIKNENKYTSPNSVVINMKLNSNDKVNKFISIDNSLDESNKLLIMKIDLRGYRDYINSTRTDEEGYILEPENVMLGVLIDGQHRTEAIFNALKLDFEIPISLYLDLPYNQMTMVFTNINEYQEKPSPTRILAVKAIAGILEDIDSKGWEYLTQLNNEPNFVLNNRIRMHEGKRQKELPLAFINGKTMHSLLVKYILPKMTKFTTLSGVKLVNSYFEAWKEIYLEAWGSKTHVLTKAMGISLLCRIFPDIYTFVFFNERKRKIDTDTFKKYIEMIFKEKIILDGKEILKDRTIILGGKELLLDWKSETFGGYSSGKGINEMCIALQELINNYTDDHILDINKKE